MIIKSDFKQSFGHDFKRGTGAVSFINSEVLSTYSFMKCLLATLCDYGLSHNHVKTYIR